MSLIFENPINNIFLLVILIYSLIFIFRIIKKPNQSSTIPNIIATLGILGTFIGILIGLLNFNPNNITESIPSLLEGMKTAFITSIVGLFVSTLLKALHSHLIKVHIKKQGRDNSEVSLEKIAELMLDMKDSITNSNSELVKTIISMNENNNKVSLENREAMSYLIESLTGEKESSLVTQMTLLRENMIKAQIDAQERLNSGLEKMGTQLDNLVATNDSISLEIKSGNDTLIEEFRVFAKNMAENNMKAFTEAIQECIRDLNNQLQEQFGENFKHLNLAVEKLLEWQVHYKETVEKTNLTQRELYIGMEAAKNLVTEINEKATSFISVSEKLGNKIITLDNQEQVLAHSIEILNKISQDSLNLIPNLDTYLAKFNNNIIATTNKVSSLSSDVKEQILISTENIESHIKEVDLKLLEHSMTATDHITAHVSSTTAKGIEEINSSSIKVLEKVSSVNQEAINKINSLTSHFEIESLNSIKHIDKIQNKIRESADSVIRSLELVSLEALNNIEENNSHLESVRKQILTLTQTSTDNIKQQQSTIVSALNSLTKTLEENTNLNISAMENQISSIEKAVTRFENEGFTLTKKISDNIQTMVENNNSNLETSIENINELLTSTLNTSLQSLGEQLAAVSEKFVDDYIPLTRELQKLVDLAKKVR